MKGEYCKFEKNIKRVFKFGWSPQYEEKLNVTINETVFSTLVTRVFDELNWTVVDIDELKVVAIRENEYSSRASEFITVTFNIGLITVNSESANVFIDLGVNSKRVKLFIHVFNDILYDFDKESLKELEKEIQKENNWGNYEIPTVLPPPQKRIEPNICIPIIGGVILAVTLGLLLAIITMMFGYLLIVDGLIIGVIIGFIFKFLIEKSNYTNYYNLRSIFIGIVLVIFVSSLLFEFHINLKYRIILDGNFLEFISLKFKSGITFKSLNMGWVGLLAAWGLQIWAMYFFGNLEIIKNLLNFQLSKIPNEVMDYTVYLCSNDYTENQVRSELAKRGWDKEEDQNDIFDLIGVFENVDK